MNQTIFFFCNKVDEVLYGRYQSLYYTIMNLLTVLNSLVYAVQYRVSIRVIRYLSEQLSDRDLKQAVDKRDNNFTELALTHRHYAAVRYFGIARKVKINIAKYVVSHMGHFHLYDNLHHILNKKELLEGGIDNTFEGHSALCWACTALRNEMVVRLLIEHGADVNFVCIDGLTPLVHARGRIRHILLLVEGCDVIRALCYAMSKKLYMFLYMGGTEENLNLKKACIIYSKLSDVSKKRLLLGLVDDKGNNILHYAAAISEMDAFDVQSLPLLSKVNKKGKTPLHCAGSLSTLSRLVSIGGDPYILDNEQRTAYMAMYRYKDTTNQRLVIEKLFFNHRPAYEYLVGKSDCTTCFNLEGILGLLGQMTSDEVERLCHLRNHRNSTLLHVAAMENDRAAMERIISVTGDRYVNCKDDCGRIPLHYATLEEENYLIEHGSHADAVDMCGLLASHRTLSLQCLAARSLRSTDGVPKCLLEFVKLHQCR